MGKMNQQYLFSFTGASLLVPEFVILATFLKENNFDYNKLSEQHIKRERATTSKREFAELLLRLKYFSENEVRLLTETTPENQRLLSLLACVRAYRILREVITDVLLERLLVFDTQLHSRNFSAFFATKKWEHESINALSDQTQKKVLQVLVKMLEQGGLIDSVRSKKITVPYLDAAMQITLSDQDKKYLLN